MHNKNCKAPTQQLQALYAPPSNTNKDALVTFPHTSTILAKLAELAHNISCQ